MAQVRQIAQQKGRVQYGLQRFILDTPDDLMKLPAKTVPGSTAYVISTGATYIHNNKHVWVRMKTVSFGSNGGSSSDGSNTEPGVGDIWDGGDIDTDSSLDDAIIWDGGGVTNNPTDTPEDSEDIWDGGNIDEDNSSNNTDDGGEI